MEVNAVIGTLRAVRQELTTALKPFPFYGRATGGDAELLALREAMRNQQTRVNGIVRYGISQLASTTRAADAPSAHAVQLLVDTSRALENWSGPTSSALTGAREALRSTRVLTGLSAGGIRATG